MEEIIVTYKTKTYIAAEWTGDHDAVEQLHKWNNSNYWGLNFHDAHELTQARDTSLNCTIKSSLKRRMDVSKCFILIVGNNTKTVRAGSCQYCSSYNGFRCIRGYSADSRSYIEYECDEAIKAGIKIVVLYNAATVDKNKCPDVIKNIGTHVAMKTKVGYNSYTWNYEAVKKALQ